MFVSPGVRAKALNPYGDPRAKDTAAFAAVMCFARDRISLQGGERPERDGDDELVILLELDISAEAGHVRHGTRALFEDDDVALNLLPR